MNRRVLLVDDSPGFRSGIHQLLRSRFEIHQAAGGDEALRLLETRGPFAVVVSDQEMPGMCGVELLARVHASWPHTARILLTGSTAPGLAVEALAESAIFRFITKPPSPSGLIDAVEAGIRQFHASEEERLLTEQLSFVRESLLELTARLEERLERELGRAAALERLTLGLRDASSLEEITKKATETLRRLFGPGRSEVVLAVTPEGLRAERPGSMEGLREKVLARGREIGHVRVVHEAGSRWPESDRRTLALVASSVSLAMESWIERQESQEVQRATVFALARLAEERDARTGRHLERVSEYCRFIAGILCEDETYAVEIDADFAADLSLAAPLHDIGKVAIPDSILNKPGMLDESEWTIMRTHAAIGAETLGYASEFTEAPFLRLAREIAWCHHERWDGSGYPRGLVGEAIPLAARIMALADCYDALTSERVYKRAWSHEEALRYVVEQRAKHFDPRIADAFVRHASEVDRIRARLADRATVSAA